MATTGEWGGLQVRFDIPELQDAVGVVNSVFSIIITALDIALTVLNIIKSFVSNLLNPVRAIIQELIRTLQNLVLDFRKAGFYVHGDWYQLLSDTTRNELRGGYGAYQQRMVTRLTDRTDPNRPTFSESLTTLALFLYVGVDISFVDGLTNFDQFNNLGQLINGFAAFFGFNINGTPLPVPARLQANFAGGATREVPGGTSESSIATLRAATSRLTGRTSTILQWGLAPSPGTDPSIPAPVIPPDGFLVEISVFPEGLYLGYLTPTPSSTGAVDGTGDADGTPAYTTAFYQESDTGNPLSIFGGLDTVVLGEDVQWAPAFEDDGTTLRAGATPAFFMKNVGDTEVLQTGTLAPPSSDGKYYNQRTIYVPHADVVSQAIVGGVYSLELAASDMPWITPFNDDGSPDLPGAVQATTAFVRVLSCSNKITGPGSFKWSVGPARTPTDVQVRPIDGFNVADRSAPSEVIEVTFPTAGTDNYMTALKTALAVMILSRSDVVLPSGALDPALAIESMEPGTTDSYIPTGLESFAQNLFPIFGGNLQPYFLNPVSPRAFGADILAKILTLADLIVEQQGNLSPALLAASAARFTELIEWQWSDTDVVGVAGFAPFNMTILGSLVPDQDGQFLDIYVGKNTRSLYGYGPGSAESSQAVSNSLGLAESYPEAGFGFGLPGVPDVNDAAPIVATAANRVARYARELFTERVYEISAQVLGLSVIQVQTTGGWIAVRPFQSVGNLSGLQDIASMIQNFLETIAAGIQGGADLILNFISMLEQRVREIQEVIRRIQSYLEIPLSITIPDALGLALVANGVSGIVNGLVSAGNKPVDGPQAYAGGIVIIGGGIPAIITDLLLLLIRETTA